MSNQTIATPEADCSGFPGNSDLYGLGIRIGVYLQWYSTWLCITADPGTASEMFAANSIFIFAIIVAVLQTVCNQSINTIEAYLMLQICLGYLLTLTGIFGLRLQLLSPGKIERIKMAMLAVHLRRARFAQSTFLGVPLGQIDDEEDAGYLSNVLRMVTRFQATPGFTLRLSELSKLKDINVSWIGAFWRISISTMVVITNAVLLFGGVIAPLPTQGLCDSNGFVFMFSRWELNGSRLTFLKVVGAALTAAFALITALAVSTFERLLLCFESIAAADIAWLLKTTVFRKIPTLYAISIDFAANPRAYRWLKALQCMYDGLIAVFTNFLPIFLLLNPSFYMLLVATSTFLHALDSVKSSEQPYKPGQMFSMYVLFASGAKMTESGDNESSTDDSNRPA
jgi:hypothetical protein